MNEDRPISKQAAIRMGFVEVKEEDIEGFVLIVVEKEGFSMDSSPRESGRMESGLMWIA